MGPVKTTALNLDSNLTEKGSAMNGFLEPPRAERQAFSRPPGWVHSLSLHQTCPHTASSEFLAGAKTIAPQHTLCLQREAVCETEPRRGLSREFLATVRPGGHLSKGQDASRTGAYLLHASCSLLPRSQADFSHFVWNILNIFS